MRLRTGGVGLFPLGARARGAQNYLGCVLYSLSNWAGCRNGPIIILCNFCINFPLDILIKSYLFFTKLVSHH